VFSEKLTRNVSVTVRNKMVPLCRTAVGNHATNLQVRQKVAPKSFSLFSQQPFDILA